MDQRLHLKENILKSNNLYNPVITRCKLIRGKGTNMWIDKLIIIN